jgi:hypothetical protein
VCVQPMLTSWSRRTEDLTFDKTDEKDAVLIARLTAQSRRCAARSAGVAGRNPHCASSVGCSHPLLIRPVWLRTAPARWSVSSCCSRTGSSTSARSPTPNHG